MVADGQALIDHCLRSRPLLVTMPQNVLCKEYLPPSLPMLIQATSIPSAHRCQHARPITDNDIREHRDVAEGRRRHNKPWRCFGRNRNRQGADGFRVPRGRCSGQDSKGVWGEGRGRRECGFSSPPYLYGTDSACSRLQSWSKKVQTSLPSNHLR